MTNCTKVVRNSPYEQKIVRAVSNVFTQPLLPQPGAPYGVDSYVGGLSEYCTDGAGGAITMLVLGPFGPLTGLTLVGIPVT